MSRAHTRWYLVLYSATAFSAVCLFLCHAGFALTQKDDNAVSTPPGRISWEIEDESNGHVFHIVPYEVVSPEGHRKCRELIGGDQEEAGKGFMFFIVIVDNTDGEEPVAFNAFGGDARFYYYPPPGPNASPRDPPPEPKRYGFISLKNYFADTGNTPQDKAGYKKIQQMFKTHLEVPPGEYGWSLACIRDSFIYDLRRNKVTWAIPGDLPQPMKLKKFSKSLLRKADVELLED